MSYWMQTVIAIAINIPGLLVIAYVKRANRRDIEACDWILARIEESKASRRAN